MSDANSCDNCGCDTENEPLTLCDDCGSVGESALSDARALIAAQDEMLKAAARREEQLRAHNIKQSHSLDSIHAVLCDYVTVSESLSDAEHIEILGTSRDELAEEVKALERIKADLLEALRVRSGQVRHGS